MSQPGLIHYHNMLHSARSWSNLSNGPMSSDLSNGLISRGFVVYLVTIVNTTTHGESMCRIGKDIPAPLTEGSKLF